VGKSALALYLAGAFSGEIVNADSRQVYRHMDIGTSKPSPEERCRVPHHLVDILAPDEEFNLASFLELTQRAIEGIHSRARLPILVGGTGQYVWALIEGWHVPRVAPDPSLRRRLETMGREALYEELVRVDPDSASSIGPSNVRRMVRALEVYYLTGLPFSRTRRRGKAPYQALVLGLTVPRQELYKRIDDRVDSMLAEGWLDEVKGLLDRGYSPTLPSMSSLGYQELASHLLGKLPLPDAVRRIKLNTHRFARHQYAWFRSKDPRIRWLDTTPGVEMQARKIVAAFLRQSCRMVE